MGAGYMTYRFFTRPRRLEPLEDVEIGDDVFVDYEEVKEE